MLVGNEGGGQWDKLGILGKARMEEPREADGNGVGGTGGERWEQWESWGGLGQAVPGVVEGGLGAVLGGVGRWEHWEEGNPGFVPFLWE